MYPTIPDFQREDLSHVQKPSVIIKEELVYMLCQFLLHIKVTQSHVYIHFYTYFFLVVYPRTLDIAPCALQ